MNDDDYSRLTDPVKVGSALGFLPGSLIWLALWYGHIVFWHWVALTLFPVAVLSWPRTFYFPVELVVGLILLGSPFVGTFIGAVVMSYRLRDVGATRRLSAFLAAMLLLPLPFMIYLALSSALVVFIALSFPLFVGSFFLLVALLYRPTKSYG